MQCERTTLSAFLRYQLGETEDGHALGALLADTAAAVAAIAAATAEGALGGHLGALAARNVQGEVQQKLDVLANETMIRHGQRSGLIAGMVSEENEAPVTLFPDGGRGRFLLAFDPLDGSSNADVNVAVGTIFSVLRHPGPQAPVAGDFLRPGREQVAAGYAIYGPATLLVLTVGQGTHGFTLDRGTGDFVLTHAA
ncbi:MAG TPA: class 1 fructose-bisphosphatase, partial [Ramlibacter sp.]